MYACAEQTPGAGKGTRRSTANATHQLMVWAPEKSYMDHWRVEARAVVLPITSWLCWRCDVQIWWFFPWMEINLHLVGLKLLSLVHNMTVDFCFVVFCNLPLMSSNCEHLAILRNEMKQTEMKRNSGIELRPILSSVVRM